MYIVVNMATFGGFVIGPFFCMEMAALKTSFAGSHTHTCTTFQFLHSAADVIAEPMKFVWHNDQKCDNSI